MAALPEFEDGVPTVVEYDLTYAADHIAIFWLSRPEAKNAVNGAPRASDRKQRRQCRHDLGVARTRLEAAPVEHQGKDRRRGRPNRRTRNHMVAAGGRHLLSGPGDAPIPRIGG